MLNFHIIFLGKTAFVDIDAGIQRYLDRVRHYVSTEIHLVKSERVPSKGSEEVVRAKESDRILRLVAKGDYLIAWDQSGRRMDSLEFSQFIQQLNDRGASNIWMAIGGPVGLSSAVFQRANSVLSLSKMTFPHDIARLIIMEQIYRAFSIIAGEPYHR